MATAPARKKSSKGKTKGKNLTEMRSRKPAAKSRKRDKAA
jgi:hypothetical protein